MPDQMEDLLRCVFGARAAVIAARMRAAGLTASTFLDALPEASRGVGVLPTLFGEPDLAEFGKRLKLHPNDTGDDLQDLAKCMRYMLTDSVSQLRAARFGLQPRPRLVHPETTKPGDPGFEEDAETFVARIAGDVVEQLETFLRAQRAHGFAAPPDGPLLYDWWLDEKEKLHDDLVDVLQQRPGLGAVFHGWEYLEPSDPCKDILQQWLYAEVDRALDLKSYMVLERDLVRIEAPAVN